jgi:hypothetical protein
MAIKPQAQPQQARPAKEAPPKGKEAEVHREEEPNVPSALDGQTHAEMLNLLEESSRTVLFAKAQQWKTVGATLLIFVALIAFGRYVSNNVRYVTALQLIVFLATPVSLLILVIYQFWQHTELAKLHTASRHLSTLYQRVRRIKSGREANLHRYILFAFMAGIIILGSGVALLSFASLS